MCLRYSWALQSLLWKTLITVLFTFVSGSDDLPQNIDLDTPTVISDKNFDRVIEKFEAVMVQFYVPWCGHCKRFSNEYTRAAEMCRQKNCTILFLVMNAEEFESTAARFGVHAYPSLRLFINQTSISYDGPRNADELLAWALKKTGTEPEEATDNNFLSLVHNKGLALVFLGPKGPEFEIYRNFVRTLEGVASIHLDSSRSKSKQSTKLWPVNQEYSILFFRDNGKRVGKLSRGNLTMGRLKAFVEKHRYESLSNFNSEESLERVFHSEGSSLLVFAEESQDKSLINRLSAMARQLADHIKCFVVRKADKYSGVAREYLGFSSAARRQVWIVENGKDGIQTYSMANKVIIKNVRAFIKRYFSGRITSGRVAPNDNSIVMDISSEATLKYLAESRALFLVFNYRQETCRYSCPCLRKRRWFRRMARRMYFVPGLEFCELDLDKGYKITIGEYYKYFKSPPPSIVLSGGEIRTPLLLKDFEWKYSKLFTLLKKYLPPKTLRRISLSPI
jgi:protein disulfide-isomerase A1